LYASSVIGQNRDALPWCRWNGMVHSYFLWSNTLQRFSICV